MGTFTYFSDSRSGAVLDAELQLIGEAFHAIAAAWSFIIQHSYSAVQASPENAALFRDTEPNPLVP